MDEAGFAILTLYVDDLILLGANNLLLNKLKKQLVDRGKITDTGDVSRPRVMNVARDREKEMITINQRDYKYTEDVIERFGIKGCNPAYTYGVELELSLNQPEEKLLDEKDKKRYRSITGAVMYLGQGFRLRHPLCRNRLARTMSKPSEVHMGAAKHPLGYLAGSVNFSITYKRGGFKLAAYSDANWGNNPIMTNRRLCVLFCSPMAPLALWWAFKVQPRDPHWKRSLW